MQTATSQILQCAALKWSPGIGDPTIGGWLTVSVYFAAAAACLFKATQSANPPHVSAARSEALLWLGFTVLLLLLGINKQLDLQSGLTAVGRCIAQLQGWYETRRTVQALFVMAIGAGGLSIIIVLARNLKHRSEALKLALWGLGGVMTYVIMRAASFHHMDDFIKSSVGGLPMNWVLEIGSVLIIVYAALQKPDRKPHLKIV